MLQKIMHSFKVRAIIAFLPWMFVVSWTAKAQLDSPFTYLSTVSLQTNFFYPNSFNLVDPPNGLISDTLSDFQSRQVLKQFQQASFDEYLPTLPQLKSANIQISEATKAIPLVVLDLEFDCFKNNVLSDSLIVLQNGYWQDVQGRSEEPFEKREVYAVLVDIDKYRESNVKFILESGSYYTNRGVPDILEINLDDGQGWIPLNFGQTVEAFYDNTSIDRYISIRSLRQDDTRIGVCAMNRMGGSSSFPNPNSVPYEWQSDITGDFTNSDRPWEFSVWYGPHEMFANAYTLWSADGVLDKPFIFVEGIDFGRSRSKYGNGSFGWYEFTSGLSEEYNFLEHMPVLLNELRANDYDIILLDFADGAAHVDWNTELLIKLIGLVNDAKVGKESNVIAGASMGGQITRLALAKMENQGIPHCSRLWVSHDSPHCGSYVPLSLMEAVAWLADYRADAEMFLSEVLQRPASRELMNVQIQINDLTPNIEHYAEMEELGYPSILRKVAIANGNGNGIGLSIESGDELLNYECNPLFHAKLVDLHFFAFPGRFNEFNALELAKVTISEKSEGFFENVLEGVAKQSKTIIYNLTYFDDVCYDAMPGGVRNSVHDFVDSFNREYDPPGNCEMILDHHYIENHSFIPTTSALGLWDLPINASVTDFLNNNPDDCPFDAYILAPGTANERHSQVTLGPEGNIEFIKRQVLNGEDRVGGVLTQFSPNSGVFNYGLQEDYFIHDIHVHNGGELYVNENLAFHFGDVGSPSASAHHEMSTSDCLAHITVSNGGLISLGSQSQDRTCTLNVMRSSSVEVDEGGMLRVNSNSNLIINNDAELRLMGGVLELNDGARIIVKEGGKLMFNGTLIKLNGSNAAIVFEGGELNVAPGETFTFTHDGNAGGYVEFSEYGQHVVTGVNSVVKFTGTNPNDVVLKITDGATLWNAEFGMGRLEIRDGKVEMSNAGHIYTDMRFVANNVIFEDDADLNTENAADVQVWYHNRCQVKNCQFNNVRFKTIYTRSAVSNTTFNGIRSGFKATGGFYGLTNCDFIDCAVKSSNLTFKSRISHSFFDPPQNKFCVQDESLSEITAYKNNFVDSDLGGIYKEGGKLILKCNKFQGLSVGVSANASDVNMSTLNRGGYNVFDNVGYCLRLQHATGLHLEEGYNDLSGYSSMCIAGTLDIPCYDENTCGVPVLATRNHWGMGQPWELQYPNGTVGPDSDNIMLFTTTEPDACAADGMFDEGCYVKVIDTAPILPVACESHILQQQSGKKSLQLTGVSLDTSVAIEFRDEETDPDNPPVSTSAFQDWPLDVAVHFAVTLMEDVDTLANDLNALDLMHEILHNELDQQNPVVKARMVLARQHMESALNNMLVQEEIQPMSPGDNFAAQVQQYVDVLNLMTEPSLSDTAWQRQFYLELEKVQLLRSLGLTHEALYVLQHIDDCGLSTLHQQLLNKWLSLVELELSMAEQYITLDIPLDALDYAVDSTAYLVPGSNVPDVYAYGSWILSSGEFEFLPCSGAFEFKAYQPARQTAIMVFPNPGNGAFSLAYEGVPAMGRIEIRNALGEILDVKESPLEPFSVNALDGLPPVPGVYFVVVSTATGRWSERVVVVN